MSEILIKNAHLVNEGTITEADVRIVGERIDAIGADLTAGENAQIIDAHGKYLIPGMIDDQVHFREPGLTHKGDIATESRAAIAGGITSYFEMPNTNPLTISHAAVEEKFQRASGRSMANFAFYLGASNDNLDQIKSLDPNFTCGVKVFMGASTGNMLVDDPAILEGIFANCPTVIATHCEDTPMIKANEEKARAQYGEDVPMREHVRIRSEEACYKSSSFAVELAKKHGTQLHVLHLTTAKELELFTAGPMADKNITAEVCVHHLFFNEDDYDTRGAQIKCNPAVKTELDRAALIQAVIDDRIDIIATDHAPHTWEEKQSSYFNVPSGLPLVQHALLAVLEQYHRGLFSLEQIVQKTSHAVADRFKVVDRGYIREGYFADLVMVDLASAVKATNHTALYKCAWTPFDGYTFKSRIHSTWVNGQSVFADGRLVEREPTGTRLKFSRI